MNLSSTHDPRDEGVSDLTDPIACLLPQLSEEDSAVLVTSLPRLDARLEHLRASFDERTLHCVAIKSNPHLLKIRVEGHTDSDGSDTRNLKLSQLRADAVMNALIDRGVEANRLDSAGFGEMKPVDTNSTPKGKANNRRVEFIIIEQE